jgi:small subunit ribosomal protein S20
MANIKSQKKRILTNERRRLRNKAVRSELKTRVKVAHNEMDAGTDEAAEAVTLAQKRLNKAGSKGTIHKNQAARRTSRLMRRAAAAAAAASES